MGLETLKQAIGQGDAGAPFTEEELTPEVLDDAVALKLVLQDVDVAVRYRNSKALPQEWNAVDELYRAVVQPKKWPNGELRAHLSMPVFLEAVENVLSQVHMAFFSDKQPFSLSGVGRTSAKAARAASKLLMWSIKQAGAKEEFRKILKSILMYGMGVGKWGWQVGKHEKATYVRENGKIKKHLESCEVPKPTLEYVELENLLVDPSLRCHDIRLARYVIHQMFTEWDDLESLKDAGYKNVPSRAQLIEILTAKSEPTEDSLSASKVESMRQYQAEKQTEEFTANPLDKPLEILEYVCDDCVITVLQRKIVLRNDVNEFGRINFVSCSFIDVLKAFFGFGMGKLLEGEQRFQAGVVNAWIDGLSLGLNPMWHRKKGVGASAQTINTSPGRVVNDDGDLNPLKPESNTQEALAAIQSSETRANRRVGANFGADMPTQALRTAEGVGAVSSGVQVRLQYFIENYSDLVFIPVLEAFVQLCKDNLQEEDIKNILTDEEGKDYDGDKLEIFNGSYSIEVLSSTKLAARRAMVSLVPQLINLFSADPVQTSLLSQKKKVDYAELVSQVIDLTGWPVQDLIVDATDEDVQRAMAMNPAAIQAQAKSAQIDQEHHNEMELENEKATGRAGNQVIRHLLQTSQESQVVPLIGEMEAAQQPAGPLATQPPSDGNQ